MKFFLYPQQSDKGPYPFPPNAGIEGGKRSKGDRHVLVVGEVNCHLYETYKSYYVGPGWRAGNGAVFDLSSDALRHECWTSADAAGLPITPALPKVDEVNQGVDQSRDAVHRQRRRRRRTSTPRPTTRARTTTRTNRRWDCACGLKASYNLSGFHGQSLVILTALKKYGAFLADNGSDWYITGATDSRWNNNDLDQMKTVPASAFEVIQLGTIYTDC